ncbi:melanoma-associated antigen B3 [Erinaceus europaeus]|uniref:Melanoma-associated antigen B3 n=1 Tax=Erinaceus europaeus TaxID=9365 RepID=A0ABM3WSH6_ERIEU|nr:melanoma-associated antigen B3 [Erinaceus europaeus]
MDPEYESDPPVHERYYHNQDESEDLTSPQATTSEEEADPSYFPHLETISKRKRRTRSRKRSRRARSTTRRSSGTRSHKETKCQVEKKQSPSEVPRSTAGQGRKTPLDKATGLLIEFLMSKYKKKKTFTKADMLRVVGKKCRNHFLEILARASFSIEVVFGVDVKEIDSAHNTYVLVSKMDLPNNGRVTPGQGFPKTGLLMNILGVILIEGNRASEEKIWDFLNRMKIYAGERHFIYGEPRKLIMQDLVKYQYLEYRQVPHSNPVRSEFLWGPRAIAETSKMRILEFLAKINHTDPRAFQHHYLEALKEEKLREQAATNTTPVNDPESSLTTSPIPNEFEMEISLDETEDIE